MKTAVRPLAIGAVLLVLAVALLLFLNHAKFSATLEHREQVRQMLVADDLAKTLESHLALGLVLEDTPALNVLLERPRIYDTRLHAVAVLDPQGQPSIVSGSGTPALWAQARQHRAEGHASANGTAAIAVALQNGFGLPAGWLVLDYDLSGTRQQAAQAFAELWPQALLTLAWSLGVLALLIPRLARRYASKPAHGERRLGLLMGVLLLLVQGSVAWSAYGAFTRISSEDVPLRAATLARTLAWPLERGLQHGIALAQLRGVNEWLQPALAASPEFAALAIEDADGSVLFKVSAKDNAGQDSIASAPMNYRFPLKLQESVAGTLVVGLDPRRLNERTRQLAMEFATLLVIGLLLSLELLHSLSARSEPDPEKAGLAWLRLPLFLFFIGSELPRAFLPMWSREMAEQALPQAWEGTLAASVLAPFAALPAPVRMTLPISAFLLTVALISPFAGRYSARHGPKRLFALGLAVAAAGHGVAWLSESLLSLVLARVLAGASFGCVSVAAFDHIGRTGGARARGMALYLAAYVAAGICGAGLGALLHERAGTPSVFVFGLLCIGLCAITLRNLPHMQSASAKAAPVAGSLLKLLRQRPFVRLVALIGLPMQLVQQGLLFYWAPLALTAQGEPTSFVGLMMMGYFVLVLLLNAPSARWADHSGRHTLLVTFGLALTGLAGLLGGLFHTPAMIGISMALVGVAWASGFPAQGALVLGIGEQKLSGVAPAVAIGVYRMVERIGAMLAPLLVALLIDLLGYAGAAKTLGALLLLCALAQGWTSRKEKLRCAFGNG